MEDFMLFDMEATRRYWDAVSPETVKRVLIGANVAVYLALIVRALVP